MEITGKEYFKREILRGKAGTINKARFRELGGRVLGVLQVESRVFRFTHKRQVRRELIFVFSFYTELKQNFWINTNSHFYFFVEGCWDDAMIVAINVVGVIVVRY